MDKPNRPLFPIHRGSGCTWSHGGVIVRLLLLLTFALALLALDWPILSIAAKRGGKGLFVYLFTVWPGVIALLWLAGRYPRKPENSA